MFNLVLILPLLSSSLLIFNKFLGVRYTSILIINNMLITFITSTVILYSVLFTGETLSFFIPLWVWFDLELMQIELGGFYDTLTAIMLCVVTFISLCVHIYSLEYMKNDPHLQRFLCYLSLFTFFMIVLVTSNNFIQLFTGWEGVGLCSYLLINFWYTRIQANKAAIKAVIVNRIGDTALTIGIFLVFKCTGSLDFNTVFLFSSDLNNTDVKLTFLFFFLTNCFCNEISHLKLLLIFLSLIIIFMV